MTPVFADTFFFLALINPRDAAHARAVAAANQRTGPLLTTAWSLTEVADALATTPDRHLAAKILADLNQEPRDIVVPASPDLFDRGWRLYLARPDKKWSLTDCISFVVMQERNVTEALTADHHFEQAGFISLLRA
jgi:predicted nucleic acid-binding protein